MRVIDCAHAVAVGLRWLVVVAILLVAVPLRGEAQTPTYFLVVTQPFGAYLLGQTISDPATMATILAGDNGSDVVKVPLSAAASSAPSTPTTTAPTVSAHVGGVPTDLMLDSTLSTNGTTLSATPTPAQIGAQTALNIINVTDSQYAGGAKGDGVTDSTAAFAAAFAAVQAISTGGTVYVPDGDYILSSSLAATVGLHQRFAIKGESAHGARLHFTSATANGIAITLAPFPNIAWLDQGPSAWAEDLTFVADWGGSTSGTALYVTAPQGQTKTGTFTYQRTLPPAVVVREVSSISKTNSGGFAKLVQLNDVATTHLDDIFMWASSGDTTATALTLTSPDTVSTGILISNLRQQSGGTALVATDGGVNAGFQGIYVDGLQTVGTQHSLSWTNPNGYTGADSLTISGKTQMNSVVSEVITNGVNHVVVTGAYLIGGPHWIGFDITGGGQHVLGNNAIVDTAAGSDQLTAIGYRLTNTIDTSITGGTICGPTGNAAGGAPIVLAGTAWRTHVTGVEVCAAAALVYDGSTYSPITNSASNNRIGGTLLLGGYTGADHTGVFSPSGAQGSTVDPAAADNVLAGTGLSASATCQNSILAGYGSICTAQNTLSVGTFASAAAQNSAAIGQRATAPYPGCITVGNNPTNQGYSQTMKCAWQVHTTATTPVRVTADGNAAASTNTMGLLLIGGRVAANVKMSIVMVDNAGITRSGVWTLPMGYLTYDGSLAAGSKAAWSVPSSGNGAPFALGTAFTTSVSADQTTSGLNLTITPPSADSLAFTIDIEMTVAGAS